MAPDNILVTVFCVTYNHSRYIRDCLNGIVAQKTNFSFEVIVQDDCSSDNTQEIILEYATKYSFIIPVFHKHNYYSLGRNLNKYLFVHANGKYIALCEGDDYWTDPYKLQKQVDFIETNKGYTFLFSPANRLNEITGQIDIRNQYSSKEIKKIGLEWVLKKGGGFYPTASILYKREITSNLPQWFFQHSTGDYPLAIIAALYGNIGYMDDIMSTYRVHGKSLTNNISFNSQKYTIIANLNKNENIFFINSLLRHDIIDDKMYRYLKTKEYYTFFSKCVNCGNYPKALNGLFSNNLDIYFKFRLLAKLLWKIIKLIKK